MFHIVDSQGRQDQVELVEVGLLLVIELVAEHLHQDVEVLIAVGEVGRQILKCRVQSLGYFLHLRGEIFLVDQVSEGLDVVNIRNKSDGEGSVLDPARPDHPDEPHGVPDVSDEQSELVQVGGDTVSHQAQLPDPAVELGGSGGELLVSA